MKHPTHHPRVMMNLQNKLQSLRGMAGLLFLLCMGTVAVAAEPATQTATTAPEAATAPTTTGGNELTDMSLEDLMNVQVTSVSKKKESIADAPAAVTVLDQDTISRSGFNTIPDLLRLAPGMDVARINSFTWAVSARGANNQFANDLLVVQDGRTLYTPTDAGVFWNTVDYVIPDLERIEVIRGPGATLWGSNAVNGVVNITSKDARDTQGWLVSGLGSNDNSNLVARYGGKISDDTFYRVYFKGKYDNALPNTMPALQQTNTTDNWESQRGGFRIDKHASDKDTFTLQGDLANDQIHQPIGVPVAAPSFIQNTVWRDSDTTGNALGRWTHRVDKDSDFSLQLYYDYLQISQGPEKFSQNTVDIDFNDHFNLGDHNEVTWGAGYRGYHLDINNAYPITLSPTSQFRNLYSFFLQDKIALTPDKLFLTLGSKLEHNDFTGFELEPSARLLWIPDKQNSVWASVSRATRSPSLYNEEIHGTLARFAVPNGSGGYVPAAATISGNPDFDSEKLVAYELGYRLQPTRRVSIDVSAYYNNYTSLQSVQQGTPQPGATYIFPSQFANGIQGDTYGGEIAANVQMTDYWRLSASYSLVHATFENMPGSNDRTTAAADSGSAPRNQAQLHSYLDITKHLHFNAGAYFTDRVNEYNVPAYVSTDLNVMWEPHEGMEVTVGVLNLIDQRHPEFGVSAGQGFADELPRTFYGMVTYRF
jgi:iron complex outermembrane receptor protein